MQQECQCFAKDRSGKFLRYFKDFGPFGPVRTAVTNDRDCHFDRAQPNVMDI